MSTSACTKNVRVFIMLKVNTIRKKKAQLATKVLPGPDMLRLIRIRIIN